MTKAELRAQGIQALAQVTHPDHQAADEDQTAVRTLR
jgi:hypothetical protein